MSKREGFTTSENVASGTKFYRTFKVDRFNSKHGIIKHEFDNAFELLVNDIYESKLHTTESHYNLETIDTEYRICLNVLRPKIQFANVNDDVFKVNGVSFTNDELVEAVKDHYAERLI